jgi:hypothetical protein
LTGKLEKYERRLDSGPARRSRLQVRAASTSLATLVHAAAAQRNVAPFPPAPPTWAVRQVHRGREAAGRVCRTMADAMDTASAFTPRPLHGTNSGLAASRFGADLPHLQQRVPRVRQSAVRAADAQPLPGTRQIALLPVAGRPIAQAAPAAPAQLLTCRHNPSIQAVLQARTRDTTRFFHHAARSRHHPAKPGFPRPKTCPV